MAGMGGAAAAAAAASGTTVAAATGINGGRFDFDDGGTYCGGWEDGKAHGHGVCTGPKGQGEYSGSWHFGFEVSGVYTWPSGSFYEGHWQNGKRHGLGVESRGRWLYRGEWTQGFKGRYGARQSTTTAAKYEGTWANGLQDGYGSETYADGGTYQGQWLRGMRHGYGVRTSAAFGVASHSKGGDGRRPSVSSLQPGVEEETSSKVATLSNGTGAKGASEEVRGGFVLKSKSDEAPPRRRSLVERTGMKNLMQGLKIRKQRSTGDLDRKGTVLGSIRSTGSTSSWMSSESNYATGASVMSEGSQASFIVEDEMLDANVTETYMGEWKNDKRCGFGISERSDGLKYEGEWFNNRKYGYGVTTFKDGTREEGKYKNNILITSNKKKHLFLIRSAKFRERIDSAVNAAQRASKIALQKADIAISRTATARGKAEQADYASACARDDTTEARTCAQTFAPEFKQPADETVATGASIMQEVELTRPNSLPAKPQLEKLEIPVVGGARGSVSGPGPPSPNHVVGNHIGPPSKSPVPVTIPVPNTSLQDPRPSNPSPARVTPLPTKPAPSRVAPPPAKSVSPTSPPQSEVPRHNSDIARFPSPPATQQPHINTPVGPSLKAPTPRADLPAPTSPEPAVLRQPSSLAPSYPSSDCGRGRTPTRQERSRLASAQVNPDQAPPAGGYNFQKIMDDRFEHYKRPPSRERSTDRFSRAGSRAPLSRDPSRDRLARPASRQRTPGLEPSFSDIKQAEAVKDSLNLEVTTGNGSAGGGKFSPEFRLPAEDQIRYRGVQQEIPHFGVPPKRTESLYMKVDNQQATFKVLGPSAMQRKKSLPDVATLPAVTVKQGSQAMTREEISVLSSARREEIRRQLDREERYRANPALVIFDPQIRVGRPSVQYCSGRVSSTNLAHIPLD